jgi:hypothetical protein
MSKSATGSESEFEFIETPKAQTPTEKVEDCGVRTTSVNNTLAYRLDWAN